MMGNKPRVKSTLPFELQWSAAEQRFWSKVQKTETCWLWTDVLVDDYATFFMGGQVQAAHRVVFRSVYGPIPDGIQVDHRCRVKHCVNPAHLRRATNKQNGENVGLNRRSTSGYRGVTQVTLPSGGVKWKAYATSSGIFHYLGLHDTPEAAADAAKAKRLELYSHNEADRTSEKSYQLEILQVLTGRNDGGK